MAKDKEREAFKQSVLRMAKYRLRGVLKAAGCSPAEVRAMEVEGEDKMIELIMTKYDEGTIDMPGLEKTGGKNSGDEVKEKPKRAAKRFSKEEEEEEETPTEDDDPYSSAFDDDINSGEEANEETSNDGEVVENDETEAAAPRKAATGRKAKDSSTADLSAIEEKLDKIMDLLVSNVEATVELSEKFDVFVSEHIDFEETVKFAFARIWKLGAANPLKPGFGDVISKAKELAAKRKGEE